MKRWLGISLFLLALALSLLAVSGYLRSAINERNSVLAERSRLEAEAKKISEEIVVTSLVRLARLSRLADVEKFAAEEMSNLSRAEQEALTLVLRAKLFEANFLQGELLLARAGGLLRSDENHPAGREYVERAKLVYDKLGKLIEQGFVAGTNDPEANARLNYLKGVYFYRSLFFIKDPKAEAARVEELVGSAMKHYSAVYPLLKRGDDPGNLSWSTDVGIELLQKQAQSMGAGGGSDADKPKLRLELLPSVGPKDRGPNFAIDGLEEGRR